MLNFWFSCFYFGSHPPWRSVKQIQKKYTAASTSQVSQKRSQPAAAIMLHKRQQLADTRIEKLRLKCRFCSMTFASAETLGEHERNHTGKKPYHCQHCLKGFTKQSAATLHEKNCPVLDILKSEIMKKDKKKPWGPKPPSSLSSHDTRGKVEERDNPCVSSNSCTRSHVCLLWRQDSFRGICPEGREPDVSSCTGLFHAYPELRH